MNKTPTESKHRYKDIWLVFKQIWYIPFIWTLAWFSYWIGHSFFVRNLLLTQIESSYYYGVAISIVFLLIAGYSWRKSKNEMDVEKTKTELSTEKELSFRNIPDEKKYQKSSNKIFWHKTNTENRGHPTPPKEKQPPIQKSQIQKPNNLNQESLTRSVTANTLSSQLEQSDQTHKIQETPSDCLVCPNLVNCTTRQKRIIDSETPCPFAKNSNKDSFESDRCRY